MHVSHMFTDVYTSFQTHPEPQFFHFRIPARIASSASFTNEKPSPINHVPGLQITSCGLCINEMQVPIFGSTKQNGIVAKQKYCCN
jgi:hypothetical protein